MQITMDEYPAQSLSLDDLKTREYALNAWLNAESYVEVPHPMGR